MRMGRMVTALLIGSVAFVFITELVIEFAQQELAEWLITVAATAIGAVLALALALYQFGYQQRETTNARREELRKLIRAELEDTAQELENQYANRPPEVGDTALVYVQPLILEQAVKSGLFSTSLTQDLLSAVRQFHTYNAKVADLLAFRPYLESIDQNAQEQWMRAREHLRNRQIGLAGQAQEVIDHCRWLVNEEEVR